MSRILPFAAVALLVLPSCQDPETAEPVSFVGVREVQEGLDQMLPRWRARREQDYEMLFQWNCFCPPEIVAPVRVTVEGGTVTAVRSADTRAVLPPASRDQFRSVDELFALLQDAVDRDADLLTADFDANAGFPRRAFINYDAGVTDEGLGFEIRGVSGLF